MVLLWLLKIMYGIALHGFVIESNLFFFLVLQCKKFTQIPQNSTILRTGFPIS